MLSPGRSITGGTFAASKAASDDFASSILPDEQSIICRGGTTMLTARIDKTSRHKDWPISAQLDSRVYEHRFEGGLEHEEQVQKPKDNEQDDHSHRHPQDAFAFQLLANVDCPKRPADVGENTACTQVSPDLRYFFFGFLYLPQAVLLYVMLICHLPSLLTTSSKMLIQNARANTQNEKSHRKIPTHVASMRRTSAAVG